MPATYSSRLKGVETSIAYKAPVAIATTVNIVLFGLQTVDGTLLVEGQRVLVKNQTNAVENGIWIAATDEWTRATDFNGARDAAKGTMVYVTDGVTNARKAYALTTDDPVIGSSEIEFLLTRSDRLAVLYFDTFTEFQSSDTSDVVVGTIAVIAEDPRTPQIKAVGATSGVAGSVNDGWEPMVFDNPADMLASSQPARIAGSIWEAGPYRYEQQETDPNGIYLTNAGGVFLKALPGDDGTFVADQFDILNATDVAGRMADAFAVADGRVIDFGAGTYTLAMPDGYDVYLLAGDDWMAGNNVGPINAVGPDAPDARILQYSYDDTTIKTASLPLENTGTATGVGPGLAFAKQILAGLSPNARFAMPANRGIILVPTAMSYGGGFSDWEQGGTAYVDATTGIDAALAHGGGTNRFMGCIFAGGFSDVGAGTTKAAAKASLTNFVTGLQTAYNTQARFVFARFITEYAATGATIDEALSETFEVAYVTVIQGLTGVQEAAQRTTAAGSRTLGANFATAFQKSGPTESTTRFHTIAGDNNRALVRDGATFSPSRPLGVTWEYENANEPTAYGVRGYRHLFERADYVSTRFTGDQWSGFILPFTEYGFSAEFDFVRDAGEWPDSPTTTLTGTAIGLPECNTNVAATASLAVGLGSQNLWGHVVVISNSLDLTHPDGKPGTMLGIEIDIQPAVGSMLDDGAGLLVNNFDDPVDFAGVSIVGDGGGSFRDGLFLGNINRYGIWFGGTFAGDYGLYADDASFDVAAISLPDGDTNGIRFSTGSETTTIAQDGTGKLLVTGDARTEFMSGNVEDVTVFAGVRESDSQEFFRVNVATGTAANAAAATVKLRANSGTTRSINAGGTINATGADYAEYYFKRDDCGSIAPGDVCGIDASGELTDQYDLAVRFVVKSTRPNLVGNDTWSDSLGERPELPSYSKPDWAVTFSLGDRPTTNSRTRAEDDIKGQQATWDAAHEQWIADKAADRTAFYASDEYQNAVTAQEDWDAAHEALRVRVDRITFCGQVPVNEAGGTAGDYVIPSRNADGSIGVAFDPDPSLADYRRRIGMVQTPGLLVVGVA